MNNEDKLKAALQNDAALRDAIRLDEMDAPKMPSDLNARLMKRMAAEAPTASRTRKLWPWIAAACAVAFIAVFITPPKFGTEGTEMVAKVEKEHEERYRKLLERVKAETVFVAEDVVMWKCRNCGHIHVGKKAPEVCPTCNHPKSYFERQAQNY